MSVPWAHVPSLSEAGPVELDADEARHLAARRLRPGDALVVFDGEGGRADATLRVLAKRGAEVECGPVERTPRPAPGFVVASAIPKGDRLSTMLQMLSQLGVDRWQPLILAESVVRRLDAGAPRLRRIAIEGAKVARRVHALAIEAPCDLDEALARHGGEGAVCFGDREGARAPLGDDMRLCLVGPEAGFSDDERARLAAFGARPASFAPFNLRIETAAVAAATAWQVGAGKAVGARPRAAAGEGASR